MVIKFHFFWLGLIIIIIIVVSCIANNIHAAAAASLRSSGPRDSYSYVLSCGTETNATDPDGRNWMPDAKFLTTSPAKTFTATADFQDPALSSTIPYMTARFLKAESNYSFPVSPRSRHWIRLHFYPSSYQNSFNCSKSFISVRVGAFTLLNNFSASITAQALTQAYIVREFSFAPIGSPTLTLTFNPSTHYNDSFVFINGIEVIPMPEIFKTAGMVGWSTGYINTSSFHMQSMYRLNVGGQYISASNDSSLTRTWYNDWAYLYGAAFGTTSTANKTQRIGYPPGAPTYIAPLDVYRSSRSMGSTGDINIRYNLTWVFRVDANFSYLVRMHFCDYQLTKVNQRVFYIYINNQTAFPAADVIAWSGFQGVATYRDFVVYERDKGGDNELWVALHPNPESEPETYDAILNGLEIFKMNNSMETLAGPNPVPPPAVPDQNSASNTSFSNPGSAHRGGIIVGSVLGVFTGFGAVLCLVAFHRRKMADRNGGKSSVKGWLPVYGSSRSSGSTSYSGKSSGSSRISNLGGGLCRHFTLPEIKLATKNFSESLVIGVGGFGKVYKGEIDGGSTKVAIKRSNPSSEQGAHEFQNEIELLSKLRHRHLVSLIGACEEYDEMILVYDYMANGTLREHLYKHNKPPLSWKQRLEICIGAARGLHYLHTGARYPIIHRDVKTTNILLDDKWVAKVSDFGLSKTGPTLNQTHVSTVVKGSFGYLDPEYFRRQQLTDKSDVYSFGVVLFEVLFARGALDTSLPRDQVSLADWALQCHRKGMVDSFVDPFIRVDITPQCLKTYVETAISCLSDHGINRPSMGSVLWNLELSMQLQSNPDGPKMVAEQRANDAYAMHAQLLSIDEGDEEEDKNQSDDAIFSQIVNPQGR
ncbi:PREDICTED: receptor-like protein kinase ANXUR1 [Ipomoea nil]|uniref:receptor-like protein kinase ANXUR1 n=1 Tax=Ipomoea nil TaxID=35883 RepID=UPI000901FE5B|nr:PREDICTED: receptor-like protein kinase ANXUR1 [Ipomoea nil]